MKIKYFGHSFLAVESESRTVFLDPFIEENPWITDKSYTDVITECKNNDLVLVSHGHRDHYDDGLKMCLDCDATLIAINDLAIYSQKQGVNKTWGAYWGGIYEENNIQIELVPAFHSSTVGNDRKYAGPSCGFVIKTEGKRVYFAGDTSLFSDLKLIKEKGILDLAFIPIGGRFTMDVNDAIVAINLLQPKQVIPIHYNTWPKINADEVYFQEKVNSLGYKCTLLEPEEKIVL